MKATVLKPVSVEISFIRIELPVRYEEEDIPNDFPFRDGDKWTATVAIDNGQIQGWTAPGHYGAEMYMKVCDEGTYTLLDHAMEPVAAIEGNYVPHGVIPGEWGDYVHLKISPDGVITNWPESPDVSAFFPAE